MKTAPSIKVNCIYSLIIAGFIIILLPFQSYSTHVWGSEITYEWVSGNSYKINLVIYRDCAGIIPPSSLSMNVTSSCVPNFNISVNQIGAPDMISPICPSLMSNSSCNGGLLTGIERYQYSATITLAPCADWRFTFSECCLNGAITSITNPTSYNLYLSASMDNLNFPVNNSPVFNSVPLSFVSNNITTSTAWGAYDTDGDSLVFLLRPVEHAWSVAAVYAPGHTYLEPFQSTSPTTLDDATGILTITPNALQVSVVKMSILKFRNGVLIGIVTRQFNIAVVNSTNNLPELTGINGTNNFITNGCPGNTITFDVFSSDVDPSQNLTVSMDPNGTNAALNTTTGQYPVGEFSWTPFVGDISSQPYVFIINVNDDHCDYYGVQSYAYHVYVNGCNTFNVWPGDANSDGTANLYDLLAVGLAYNDIGPFRPSANLSWTGQPCSNWNNWFVSGINHKHADTDGDGVVNANDTTAIMLNYGLNHPLRAQHNSGLLTGDLSITANYDTVGTQTQVTFDIAIDSPVDSIYGLAFRIFFDPSLADMNTATITYPGSMFGTNGVDMIKINKVHLASGFVDIALSRIDQQNISGTGPVARITIVTTDNVSGKVTLNVEPTDVVANTAFESPVLLNTIGDEVVIDPNLVGLNLNTIEQQFLVHPVPTSDILHINYTGFGQMHFISIFDVSGKEVLSMVPGNKVTIDISPLSKGVYYMKSGIDEYTIIKKIVRM